MLPETLCRPKSKRGRVLLAIYAAKDGMVSRTELMRLVYRETHKGKRDSFRLIIRSLRKRLHDRRAPLVLVQVRRNREHFYGIVQEKAKVESILSRGTANLRSKARPMDQVF
jgi:hypothetical protein